MTQRSGLLTSAICSHKKLSGKNEPESDMMARFKAPTLSLYLMIMLSEIRPDLGKVRPAGHIQTTVCPCQASHILHDLPVDREGSSARLHGAKLPWLHGSLATVETCTGGTSARFPTSTNPSPRRRNFPGTSARFPISTPPAVDKTSMAL